MEVSSVSVFVSVILNFLPLVHTLLVLFRVAVTGKINKSNKWDGREEARKEGEG